jgi:hypothetical protein
MADEMSARSVRIQGTARPSTLVLIQFMSIVYALFSAIGRTIVSSNVLTAAKRLSIPVVHSGTS